MSSLMVTHSSLTTSRLILSRRDDRQICFRACNLSIRSASCKNTKSNLLTQLSMNAAPMLLEEKPVAYKMMKDIKFEASRMNRTIGVEAGLAVIHRSVDGKLSSDIEKTCKNAGLKPFIVGLAEDSSVKEVLKSVSRLNDDPCVHGIVVHRDLPWRIHIDKENIVNAIAVEKNVEGIHPLNIARETFFVPCSPKACIELLRGYNIDIKGKRAVVVGRGDGFCIPIALLLEREDATVTIINSETLNPEEITRQADIVISANGLPPMVRGSWIKPGAVVITIGVHRKLYYEEVCKVASAITPLASRANGRIALALALSNTLTSAKRFHNFM